MCSDMAITVRNLSKHYQVYDAPKDRLKQMLWRGRRRYYREFCALNDVSFDVGTGETVGIIGSNGSGKSTLLQIICGVLTPTSGTVQCSGRVAALLELGSGFNPEFSGHDNLLLNATILGLSREEALARYDDIVRFADIGSFIHQPVKTYSSGMYVRLAFAVAIHVSPDILVVDEALAVGDAAFQCKCLDRLQAMCDSGTSVLFVSHDIGSIKRFCSRAIWLHQGKMAMQGEVHHVADAYQSFVREQTQRYAAPTVDDATKPEDAGVAPGKDVGRIVRCLLRDDRGEERCAFVHGDTITVCINYELFEAYPGLVVGCALVREDGLYVTGLNSGLDKVAPPATAGSHSISLAYRNIALLSGSYTVKIGLFDERGMATWDFHHSAAHFSVTAPYLGEGVYLPHHEWSVE